jgi:excisionase family DNA binding protein
MRILSSDRVDFGPLLHPGETAAPFGMGVRTVVRWASEGTLAAVRTVGCHRRFYSDDDNAILRMQSLGGSRLGRGAIRADFSARDGRR